MLLYPFSSKAAPDLVGGAAEGAEGLLLNCSSFPFLGASGKLQASPPRAKQEPPDGSDGRSCFIGMRGLKLGDWKLTCLLFIYEICNCEN